MSVPKALNEYKVPVTLREPTASDRELGYIRAPSTATWSYSSGNLTESEQRLAPPAYGESPSCTTSTKAKRSVLASLFSCLRRSRSRAEVAPPPYVSAGEIALMEERLRQLDTFFGGAAL